MRKSGEVEHYAPECAPNSAGDRFREKRLPVRLSARFGMMGTLFSADDRPHRHQFDPGIDSCA
jgi:hypothetical protein